MIPRRWSRTAADWVDVRLCQNPTYVGAGDGVVIATVTGTHDPVPKTDGFGLTSWADWRILRSAGANVSSICTGLNPDKGMSNVRI